MDLADAKTSNTAQRKKQIEEKEEKTVEKQPPFTIRIYVGFPDFGQRILSSAARESHEMRPNMAKS